MSVSTLRPNERFASPTMAVVGGSASEYAALSDDSDSNYVEASAVGQRVSLEFTDFTLPAGAVLRGVRGRLRQARTGSGQNHWRMIVSSGAGDEEQYFPSTSSITTLSSVEWRALGDVALSDSAVDAVRMVLEAQTDGGIIYEAYVDVIYVTQPTLTVLSPSGTVTEDNRPLIVWNSSGDIDGGPQTHYDVKVFSSAQYSDGGFDPDSSTSTTASGIAGGATAENWQMDATLPDGDYRAYVRIAQTVNGEAHWSGWEYVAFTVDVLLPRVPQMTVDPQASSGRVRVRLDNMTGGATSTDGFELQRSVDNGLTWQPVRNEQGDNGEALQVSGIDIDDYEAPNGSVVLYRARALHNYSGVYVASDWNVMSYSWEDGSEQGWTMSGFTSDFGSQYEPVRATTGERVLRCTGTITDNDGSAFSPVFAIEPDRAVSARADIYVAVAANGPIAGRIEVLFDDGSGAWALTSVEGPSIAGGTGARVATVLNAVAPATTTRARLRIVGDTTGTSTIDWRIDTVQYRIGDLNATAELPGSTWESTQWWLKHPLRPALNLPVTLFSYPDAQRAARQGVIQPLGATLPVVVSDTRGGATGTVVLQCYTAAERDALNALLDTLGTLLLQGPAEHGKPDRYVKVGDHSSVLVIDRGWVHITRESLPWIEVAVPAGALSGEYAGPAEVDDGEELVVA